MNNPDSDIQILNLKIENWLYPLISMLKETNKPKLEIVLEIAKFKENNRQLMNGLDKNYIEKYLNNIHSKRSKGAVLIEIKDQQEEER